MFEIKKKFKKKIQKMPALKPYLEKIFLDETWLTEMLNYFANDVLNFEVKIMWISVLCAIVTNSQFLCMKMI